MKAWLKSWIKTQFDNFANRVAAVFARKSDIPTKTSELTNDSGFKTFDAVTSVNGKTGAVNIEIPAVYNGTLTIQKNGTNVQTFTANQSTSATANIEVPTVSSSAAVTQRGQIALDAVEKNASVEGTLANQIGQVNSNLSGKTDESKIPYGFRNFTKSRWLESTYDIDDLPDGLSVRGPATEEYNFSDTWYYFTFYEGGNNNKDYGIQFAFARQSATLIMRYKQGGKWNPWKTISS